MIKCSPVEKETFKSNIATDCAVLLFFFTNTYIAQAKKVAQSVEMLYLNVGFACNWITGENKTKSLQPSYWLFEAV